MPGKILFDLANFDIIYHCVNRQAWLKRAFGMAKPFWISESACMCEELGSNVLWFCPEIIAIVIMIDSI